ncbi:MAG: bifunctional tetrahydrofolate synthase/dihydrofolate synthase, partial [Steroidobacteraceae bacterium]
MRFDNLAEWLSWQERLHPTAIDLGLERIRVVLQRLGWRAPQCPIITIAGTKGKGSCAALLESIYRSAKYRVGMLTSPHLRSYTERIRIVGEEVSAAELCSAFPRIDVARGDISLTYFEFNTLAALLTFETANLDVWILEVGMGGRLDAVNVVDADVALVTSIGLDHTEWLGNDLGSIAREKAGICRRDKPLVFGAMTMPQAIAETAQAVGASLLRAGQDFRYVQQAEKWHWQMQDLQLHDLPFPAIAGAVQLENASSVLAVVKLLDGRLPVGQLSLAAGLRNVRLPGRFQVVPAAQLSLVGKAEWILDVAHNELSAQVLATHLAMRPRKSTAVIVGVMADKDITGMLAALRPQVDYWLPVALPSSRALPVAVLADRLHAAEVSVWE